MDSVENLDFYFYRQRPRETLIWKKYKKSLFQIMKQVNLL